MEKLSELSNEELSELLKPEADWLKREASFHSNKEVIDGFLKRAALIDHVVKQLLKDAEEIKRLTWLEKHALKAAQNVNW